MEFHLVSTLLRKALEELKRIHGADSRDMRVVSDSQWWLAMAMLDHCRPAVWFRSSERADQSARLSKICDEYTPSPDVEVG
ncbi:hypothetical protein NA78x_001783 [Anatilimnocola sp. NA78]|uniref:hypothetical protein n=1 Tax=Anatilimnocola sp. NA78 TaxID=3415683 RepID=UPI003CE46724